MYVISKSRDIIANQSKVTFNDIQLNQENNIKAINELRYHKAASYALGGFTTVTILVVTIIVIVIIQKQNKMKIRITNKNVLPE